MTSRTPVDVAAGVLIRPDGRFLLASRPLGKPYATYWEFPGGKVEAGESIAEALARELHEELAIEVEMAYPWVVRVFDYPHALVRLHFCRVFRWRGEPQAREHQCFGFFSSRALPDGLLLPATVPVLRWLDLPAFYAISAVAQLGRDVFLRRLDVALERGLRMVQFREPALDDADAASIFPQILARVRAVGAILLVNSRHQRALWELADGVHLTVADVARASSRPALTWVAASAHSTAEIGRAADLGVDFVVAGAVLKTATHPSRVPLGWSEFAKVIAASAVPVYALGGLQAADVLRAMRQGAHGIASQSAIWGDDQCFSGAGARPAESALASASLSGA